MSTSQSSPLERQIGGKHYKGFKIQPIEFVHGNGIPFIEGSIIKYICRWRDKGGIQDLEKIKHYVDLLIELENAKDTGRQAEATVAPQEPHQERLAFDKVFSEDYPFKFERS